MLAPAKAYLKTVLMAIGIPEKAVYTDAAQAAVHKRPPWSSILTPPEREAEVFTRLARPVRLAKYFYPPDHPGPEEPKTWAYVVKLYDTELHLDVVISAETVTRADSLKVGFLAGVAREIFLDPEAPEGYVTSPSEVVGLLNFRTGIEVASGVWSDGVAKIRDEDQVNLRVVFRGAVLALESMGVIKGVRFGLYADGEEVPNGQE